MNITTLLLCLLLYVIHLCASEYIPVPGGFAWDECVHHVPSDSHIYENSQGKTLVDFPNGTTMAIPPCTYPRMLNMNRKNTGSVSANGWQSWASFNTPDNSTFTSFNGNFTVPNAPKDFSVEGILYLFTGLQIDNWIPTPSDPTPTPPGFDIIQPVLQYGRTPDRGGQYWGIASWYATLDDGYVVSKLAEVKPGDVISGVMTQGTNPSSWFIGSQVLGTKITSNIQLTKPRLASQPWAYVTLEVYNIDECTYMPSSPSVPFTDLVLTTAAGVITPSWNTFTGPSNNPCNTKCNVISSDHVEIQFAN